MPELPEVETVKRAIASIASGKKITDIFVGRKNLRWPIPTSLNNSLEGVICKQPQRRGKYILIPLSTKQILLIHLGMSGAFRIYKSRPNFQKHDHVAIGFESEEWLVFSDPRRFGCVDLFKEEYVLSHWLLKNLGPEPLSKEFTPDYIITKTASKTCSIKTFLLDQRNIAGIGNIYASEALHFAGISPNRKAKNVQGRRAHDLASALVKVLNQAIAAGGATLKDHRTPFGEIGYFQNKLQVYGREGETCKTCLSGSIIKKIVQANRSTFFCPKCQR